MMPPLVSILMPAYNAEQFLAETLASARAQTWPRTEIIVVVDDGSKDNTLAVAKQFAAKNISVVTRPHQRAAAARNEAFAICQGDFVMWLDADDLLSPDKIARQVAAAEKCDDRRMLLSCGWGFFNYRTSKAKFHPTSLWCDLSPQAWLIRKMGSGSHMQPGTWLARRETVEAAGNWDAGILVDEDGEYINRLVLASSAIKFVPEAKVFYRVAGAGSYTRRVLFFADERWHSMKLQYAQLRSLGDSEPVRKACVDFLQEWLPFYYPHRPDIVAEAQQMAAAVGGKLETPRLRPKYAWIEKFLGYEKARRAQFVLPQIRGRVARGWDKAMLDWESWRGGGADSISTMKRSNE